MNRKRHPGHLDDQRSRVEVLASIRAIAGFGRLEVGPRIDVDTSQPPDLDVVLRQIRRALAHTSAED